MIMLSYITLYVPFTLITKSLLLSLRQTLIVGSEINDNGLAFKGKTQIIVKQKKVIMERSKLLTVSFGLSKHCLDASPGSFGNT